MGSMAVTSAFATTGAEVNTSITKYSKASLDNSKSNPDSIIFRSSTLMDNLVNDTNVQKHMANIFIGDKTSKLKGQATTYLASSKEKLERKKAKLVEKEAVAKKAKGFAKIKAWKEVLSAKVEQEKQRGRKNAAKKVVAQLDKFENDGFYKTQYELANGIRIDYKNGFNAYNASLVNPSKDMLSNAWSAATKFNYVDYTTNMHDFWNVRMNVWNDATNLSNDTIAFNELTSVAMIEAIAKMTNQTTEQSIIDYANV